MLSPTAVADKVRSMVAGDGTNFGDLFAEDGVLEYPFAMPGQPPRLDGRAAIRSYFSRSAPPTETFDMAGVDLTVHETADPELVVAEIEHHGELVRTRQPYRFKALGVIRVRQGEIVSYQDYMDPLALARLLGRTDAVAAALHQEAAGAASTG